MNRYFYDVHIHSCLSPCGDNDMTPNNIAGMGALNGLQIMALTDHNTCRNCPAFFEACKKQGIVPIAGMELTTSEDIHVICLFPTLDAAMAFDAAVGEHRVRIPNRPDIFGEQLILNAEDEEIGREPDLLPNATDLSLEDGVALARSFGAVTYPAHIDREANGIIAVLGDLPTEPTFTCVEYRDAANAETYPARFAVGGKRVVVCSDAHYLWDIAEAQNAVELEDEPYSSERVRKAFLDRLRSIE